MDFPRPWGEAGRDAEHSEDAVDPVGPRFLLRKYTVPSGDYEKHDAQVSTEKPTNSLLRWLLKVRRRHRWWHADMAECSWIFCHRLFSLFFSRFFFSIIRTLGKSRPGLPKTDRSWKTVVQNQLSGSPHPISLRGLMSRKHVENAAPTSPLVSKCFNTNLRSNEHLWNVANFCRTSFTYLVSEC